MTLDHAVPAAAPRDLLSLPPVPHGATASRVDWLLLPPALRRLVEDRFGTPVVESRSAGAGYTPGLASVLVGANGRRMFLKAASKRAQRPFAEAYSDEIRTLRSLPSGLPVPRLLWSHEDDRWVLLALEHVEGANPARPWDLGELGRCLDTLQLVAQTLTPPPMRLRTFAEEFEDMVDSWHHVRLRTPDWPHLEEAAELAANLPWATAGNTLVHTDARDDNFVVTANGRPRLVDWNLPVVGAAWIDTVCLLMTAFGDGVDADALLAERALTRKVAADDVDTLLALLCGYFLERRVHPTPYTSPFLRRHQDWCAEVTWAWLAQRRGWSPRPTS